MAYIFIGLGNPGQDYENTRHNTGRMILRWFGDTHDVTWKEDQKLQAWTAKLKIGKTPVTLVLPDTYMNNSGKSVKPLVTTLKGAEKVLVIYDDLDLPFGSAKMSFNKSSGGHKGVESIIKSLKTEKFSRIRIGISPTSPTGKLRKPQGEDAVTKVILGQFKPAEILILKKIFKKVAVALETLVSSGHQKAMTEFN